MKSLALVRVLFSFVLLAASLFTPIPAQSSPIPSPARWEAPALRAPAAKPAPAFVPDRLLVQFQPGVQSQAWAQGRADSIDAEDHLPQPHILGMRPLLPSPSANTLSDASLSQIYLLDLASGSDVLSAAAALSKDPAILWAEPDYLAEAAALPNDPLYPQQWGLDKIGAPDAWEVVTGTQTVVIAVLDSGIEFSHADFSGRLWTNPGEIAANGLDDDNNGYVDDLKGWDFVNGDNNPADDNGHGTQAAGIAAGAGNDGTGIAGVCWNCKILPLKVMQVSGVANYSDITAGIWYAAQKGAKVINLSLGGYSYSNAMRAAVQAAVDTYSVVLVGGAGNDNLSTPFYPAAYDEVIAVAGTTESDAKAAFSDYGDWVDLCAPSTNITTTYLGGDWGPANGTSFAAPFVSGLAGLIRTQHPDWSPATVQAQMERTADAIDVINPGYAGQLGSGRINAGQAILVKPYPIVSVESTSIDGDPQGRPTPGESATMQVTLANEWWDARDISGTLSTSDPLVTVTKADAIFGDLPAGGSAANSNDFAFQVDGGAGYNHPIPFQLNISAFGGAYTAIFTFTIYTRSADEILPATTILENTTWTSDKTYILTGNVGVAPGVTLTIQAGTVVKFDPGTSLNVGGALIADGTQSQPIRFLKNGTGDWGQVFFDDPSMDAATNENGEYLSGNILRWVTIEGAASGIGCSNATPYLSHLTTDKGGMNCTAGGSPLWLLDSRIQGNMSIEGSVAPFEMLGIWSSGSSSYKQCGMGFAAANTDLLYAVGGYDPIDPFMFFTAIKAYDPAADTWATRANMPTARSHLGVTAASNGLIYAIGGSNDGNDFLDTVEAYDPVMDSWTTLASLPTPRRSLGSTEANGKVYAIGGSAGSFLDTVEEYDPATDTWTTRTSLPTPRNGLGVATGNDGLIYAIGGANSSGILGQVEAYNPATDAWTTRASLSTPRRSFGVTATSNGKIYVIGGWGNGGYITTVEEYDPVTNTWTTRTSLPTPREDLGVAGVTNGKIYVFGGLNHINDLCFGLEVYDPQKDIGTHIAFQVQNTTIQGSLSLPGYSQVWKTTVAGNITAGEYSVVASSAANGGIILGGEGDILDTTAGGTISLGSGVAQNNTVTGGGITVTGGEVLSNTLTGGGISAGNGSTVRGNNIENNSGWGITTSGVVTVEKNRLVGNAGGIYATGGDIQGNLIANSAGVGIEIHGNTTVISNTLHSNEGSAIKLVSGTTLQITGNNLEFNKGTYDIENLIPKTTLMMVPAQGNWWGVTSNAAIAKRIYDINDGDYSLGQVLYAPAANGPIQTAPAYVRNVTLTPESPVGIETVTFDVEFSRPMDTNTNPEVTFLTTRINSWIVKTPLPNARSDLSVVSFGNGKIYAIGGHSSRVDEYDPATDTWVTKTPMPTLRSYMGVAVASNGKIYTIGGESEEVFDPYYNVVEEYDPLTDTWTTKTPMPTARSGLGVAVASNGKIYAIGGGNNTGFLSTVEEYDPLTDTWTTKTPMPTARSYVGVVTGCNNKIYVIGGLYQEFNISIPTVEEYDPLTDTWTSKMPMPLARSRFGVVSASNGKIYAIGGWESGFAYSDVQEYNPLKDTWIMKMPMPTARNRLGAAEASNKKIYAIGGWTTSETSIVEEYTLPDWGLTHVSTNPQWFNNIYYQAIHDITALLERGDYRITVASAMGTDGIEIAPNTSTTFTVDYAGAISDITPPSAPTVLACGAASPDTLSSRWSASDPDSTITRYQYAIGSTPGGVDVVYWTPTQETSFLLTGLNLTGGQTYYVSAKARNEGGIWSDAGVSSGVVAGSGTCPAASFSASPASGYVPLTVVFTDTSSGAATAWLWDFGDGETSTIQHPTHVYTATGVFTVSLQVSGPSGSDLHSEPAYITVTPPQTDSYPIFLPLVMRSAAQADPALSSIWISPEVKSRILEWIMWIYMG